MSRLDRQGSGNCENCGLAAHEHSKERVRHGNDTWGYEYHCQEGDAA